MKKFNREDSLGAKFPELAKEWHPTKNGDLTPFDVLPNSGQKVWWLLPYDDSTTKKHFDFEWKANINNRTNGSRCPFIFGRSVWRGFNDLQTLYPQIASEWHPTKNGQLTPSDVTYGSHKEVWWYLPYDDPITGKHFNFEWKAIVKQRTKGNGCPYLNSSYIWVGFNDLASNFPNIAKEWHPTKNGKLTPFQVAKHSPQKVWWYLPYDDPITGKHFDFEWQARVADRVDGNQCPYLVHRALYSGFNDLETKNPELAKEWHPIKNGKLKPSQVMPSSKKKIWWLYSYDDPISGKHFDFEWQSSISNRCRGQGCPYITNNAIWPGFNDLETRYPQLAKEWHPTKNGKLKPSNICPTSRKKVWWYLPYDDPITGKHFNFEWKSAILTRTNGNSACPYLTNNAIWPGFNDLETKNPELAKEWHPTKNGKLKPSNVFPYTSKKVWWLYIYDDPNTKKHYEYEWQTSVSIRHKGASCPYISSSKTEILLYNFLKNQNIDFLREESFKDCKNINSLLFDIFIKKYNILIEIDGIQHFIPIDYFGGKNALAKQKRNDNIKNKYCKDNNIPLLRVPYIYDPIINKDKIEQIVLDFINNKTISQEIIDFYKKYKWNTYAKYFGEEEC